MSDYKFQTTVEPKKLAQLFEVAGSEWSGPVSAAEFGQIELKRLVDYILSGRAGRAFYLEARDGRIGAIAVVKQTKALYKEPLRAGVASVPDLGSFGVRHITGLQLGYVFTAPEVRGKGLMDKLVRRAVAYTEDDLVKKELAKLSDKKDLFRLMVTTDGKVDSALASHYLRKKYVWYLYLAVGAAPYARFGFKPYPLEGYRIPLALAESDTQAYVEKLLGEGTAHSGKKLRLLDGARQLDMDLVALILLGRELDLLTEMNKNISHLELFGGQRSSSSLTNVAHALSAARSASHRELSAISELLDKTQLELPEKPEKPEPEHPQGLRRKLSVQHLAVPKVALVPDLSALQAHFPLNELFGERSNADAAKYARFHGAVLTNELQQKSFYVLWVLLKWGEFYIVGMGELKLDLFGAVADPTGLTNPVGRRRGLSFTGLNEMGGLNFQDLDLLLNAAVYVAKRRQHSGTPAVYATINDLPATVPAPVLHDFFLNYLPRNSPVAVKGDAHADAGNTVEFVEDFASRGMLPMMRQFGSESAAFDLDWVGSSMLTWG